MGKAFLFGVGGGAGGGELAPLNNPAAAVDIMWAKEAYDDSGRKIVGTNTGVATSDLDGLVDGSIVDFVMPPGKTKIEQYRFYQFANLTTIDLTGVIEIGANAFYECTGIKEVNLPGTLTTIGSNAFYRCDGITKINISEGVTSIGHQMFYACKNLVDLTLPDSLRTIDITAFAYCEKVNNLILPKGITSINSQGVRSIGRFSSSTFEFTPTDRCELGSYAFSQSCIAKVSGLIAFADVRVFSQCDKLAEVDIECDKVERYSFYQNTALTKLHLKINGLIGSNAFEECIIISDFYLDPESVITTLGSYAFSKFGSGRANAATNRIEFDLRKSTFNAIPQYGFGGSSSTDSYRNKHMDIMFPDTVTSIDAYAFRYTDNCNFYFTSTTPPPLSVTTAWQNATNYNIFVPYQSVNAYRSATNWTAQADYIKGFASENTFEVGYTLPDYNVEGYALTWYSDAALTTPVTTVGDVSAIYYCVVGTEKLAWGIAKITAFNCSVAVSDGVKNYVEGEGIPFNTILTITAVPLVSGYVPHYIIANGIELANGGTFTMTEDLGLIASCYDGQNVPFEPIFENCPWEAIRKIFRDGTARYLWSLGDTKSVTLMDSTVMTLRITDMQSGRYALTDGSGYSNGVLEFVELFPTVSRMNTTGTNYGGWESSYMKKTTMQSCFDLLPTDLQSAISEVSVLSGTGGRTTSGTSASDNKLFLPCVWELFGTASYSIGITESPLGQFDYYKENNTNDARVKYRSGVAQRYWERSPNTGSGTHFNVVDSSGGAYGNTADTAYGVAPCFAI